MTNYVPKFIFGWFIYQHVLKTCWHTNQLFPIALFMFDLKSLPGSHVHVISMHYVYLTVTSNDLVKYMVTATSTNWRKAEVYFKVLCCSITLDSRDLKQWLRRRLDKNQFIFYLWILQIPRSVQYAYRSQKLLKFDSVMPAFNSKTKYEK